MSSYLTELTEKKLLHPPKWLANNVMFEGMTGSVSYGVSNDSSDMDVVGFCMPPKEVMFPHLRGEIQGFGTPGERFEQFQQHGIKDWNLAEFINNHNIPDSVTHSEVILELKKRGLI